MRYLVCLALAVACAPDDERDGRATEGEPPLPEVWGLEPLEDHDPDPDVVEVHLTIDKTRVEWMPGTTTQAWAYNGVVPGPVIQAEVGDTLRVVFTNGLKQDTTIHWHGLRIPDAMDGVPAVQDPVGAGETFVYEFELPDAGSFWYHPHVRAAEQMEHGLYGALVVHEKPEDRPTFDRERYFVIDDVGLDDDGDYFPFGGGMDGMHGRHGNILLTNGVGDDLADEIPRGTRERWRIVNVANARTMWVDVKGADWRVVAVDGTLLPSPWKTGRNALLEVGRRLDLEVVPKDDAESVELQVQLPDAYGGWYRYPQFEGTLTGDAASPGFMDWSAPALPEPRPIEQEIDIVLGADTSNGLAWTINGSTYEMGDAIPARAHTPTRIRIVEDSGAPHPFHLHGQFFQVLDRDGLDFVPGQLDTLIVDGLETVEVYTELDNPGVWMAHCHILDHADLGMMTELHVE